MTDGLKAEYRAAIIDILAANERVERVVLFGSRAMETFTPASDVDIALFGDRLTLTDQANLATAIDELPIAQRVDLLLHKTVSNEALREHIEQYGVEWYRRRAREEIEREYVVLVEREERRVGDEYQEAKEVNSSPLHIPIGVDSIPLKWRWSRLEDICDGIFDCPHATPKLSDSGPLMARTQDILSGVFRTDQAVHVLEETYRERTKRAEPTCGDLFYSREGTYFGIAAEVPQDCRVCLGQRMVLIRPNSQSVDFHYLRHWLNSPVMESHIHGFRDGTVAERLNLSTIRILPVLLPPLPEQRAIAHILGPLDDKIELNRRMNETLEEMARTLFKSWFVDFVPVHAKAALRNYTANRSPLDWTVERARSYLDGMDPSIAALFPDRFVDSELGEIPEGWKVKRIEDIAERVAMGPFGSSIKVSTFVDEGVPVISGQHLNDTLLSDNKYRFITEEHAEKLKKANVQRGDVIFTHAGNIGQVAYIPQTSQFERYIISQRQFYMRCDVSQISPVFVVYFFKTSEGRHKLLANASSTGVPSISRPVTYLRSIKLRIPPKALSDRFNEIVGDLHLKTGRDTAESRSLTILRDTLLPKLISGEIRVRGAERFLSGKVS